MQAFIQIGQIYWIKFPSLDWKTGKLNCLFNILLHCTTHYWHHRGSSNIQFHFVLRWFCQTIENLKLLDILNSQLSYTVSAIQNATRYFHVFSMNSWSNRTPIDSFFCHEDSETPPNKPNHINLYQSIPTLSNPYQLKPNKVNQCQCSYSVLFSLSPQYHNIVQPSLTVQIGLAQLVIYNIL